MSRRKRKTRYIRVRNAYLKLTPAERAAVLVLALGKDGAAALPAAEREAFVNASK